MLAGLSIALALQSADMQPIPYKVDDSWLYYRMHGLCTAFTAQESNAEGFMMAYDPVEKAFRVGFTKKDAADAKVGDTRAMDIRLHRPGGVLDDGWEDVEFDIGMMPDGRAVFTGQWMDIPASRDFAEMESVVFIDHGKTAGSFRVKHPKRAVSEILRCARQREADGAERG